MPPAAAGGMVAAHPKQETSMHQAVGSRVSKQPARLAYRLRLAPADFDLVSIFALLRGLSFNEAIAELVRSAGRAGLLPTEPAVTGSPSAA
jgi:hypothetical protein